MRLTCRKVVFTLHHAKLLRQVCQQLLLGLLLAHHGRHLLPQVPHDEEVNLGCSNPLHKLIHLGQHIVALPFLRCSV